MTATLTLESLPAARTTLPEDARTTVAVALQATLVDMIDLALQAKQAHWALVGVGFQSLHEQLDVLTAAYQDAGDEVAERLTALQVVPDGRVATVAAQSGVEAFPSGVIRDAEVRAALAERLSGVVQRVRGRLDAVGEADPVSEDLLIGLVGALEKQLWMIQAQAA
jgi:starvation-inducible DNA-binding protein